MDVKSKVDVNAQIEKLRIGSEWKKQVKFIIKQYALELVGKNDKYPPDNYALLDITKGRNELRSEQRAKIDADLGGK